MVCKRNALIVFVICSAITFSSGCSEREEPDVAPGSTLKADLALREAEENLRSAGVLVAFDDPGELTHLENLVPMPSELGDPKKQRNFESAIEQLNIVAGELEQELDPSASYMGSASDRALMHLYLGLSYLLDALSRLLISDDPEETFIIEYDPSAPSGEWFSFDISDRVKAKLDSIRDPLDYPLAFTLEERQAIIDAIDLISDATVKPKAQGIQPRSSSTARPPYSRSAIWHFNRSASIFGQYSPDLMKKVEDFNEQMQELESALQRDSEKWGFTYTPSSEASAPSPPHNRGEI